MIRVITLEDYDEKHLAKFCQVLYTAFGVGSEHSGSVKLPPGINEPYDVNKLIEQVDTVRAYADDKLLYLTPRKLKERELPGGVAPTHGCALYGKNKALITTHGLKNMEESLKQVGRHALHQLGHLWELHHCLDPRCSMYPPWTPSFAAGDSIFCTFCREKSEQKIRLAKS